MQEGGQMVDLVEGPPGVLTGTALATVNQVSRRYLCHTALPTWIRSMLSFEVV